MYIDNKHTAQGGRAEGDVLERLLAENGICRPELRSDLPSDLSDTQSCRIRDGRRPQKANSCFPDGKPVGMVYSPPQEWRALYEPEKALSRGTLFEELDLVFLGSGGGCGGACHE